MTQETGRSTTLWQRWAFYNNSESTRKMIPLQPTEQKEFNKIFLSSSNRVDILVYIMPLSWNKNYSNFISWQWHI